MADGFAFGSELKTLEYLVEKESRRGIYRSILITHVLPTSEKYIELVNKIFPVSLLIAIPYSAHKDVLNRLESKGIPVYLPDSIDDAFLSSGPEIEKILQKSSDPIIVQEVGGYLAGYTKKLSEYPHFIGIVEDTNNGHWRYESAGVHNIPVLSMAQSPIKDIEDTVIGDGVVYSTEKIFREEFHAIIQGMRCGVIGYGKIGTSTSVALKGREATVAVYDIDPAKCIRAKFEGYSIMSLNRLLNQSELIIGCTGKTSVRAENINHIRNNAILVSASAKNEEFDLIAFDEYCNKEILSPVIWRYTRPDGGIFYLLNKGTPVNFRDNSILGSILDMIYSELFLCICEIAFEKYQPGLQKSPSKVHTEVAKTWLMLNNKNMYDDTDDKIWNFPFFIKENTTRTFMLQTAL